MQRTMQRTAKRQQRQAFGLGLSLALLALGCGGSPETAPATGLTVSSLALAPATVALVAGQTQALAGTATFSDHATAQITTGSWSTSAAGVATVSSAGLVTAVAAGKATITLTWEGRSAGAAVTVSAVAPTLVSVAVAPSPLKLTVGNSAQLTLTGTYSTGAPRDLTSGATWTPGDASIISVTTGGQVTGLHTGTTTLTGAATDGSTRSGTIAVEVSAPAGYDPSAGWTLVWSDEFDGTAVDPTNWTFDLGAGGWGNNESEYYQAANAVVENGALTITAKIEAAGDAPYTSARLQTSQKRAFTYGKFSMRAKLPYSQAMWPAFWLLGANSNSQNGIYGGDVTWPGCGEADIMEMIGGLADGSGDYTTHGTLHYFDATNRDPGPSYAYRYGNKLAEDFHLYELTWTPHSFTWTFDGVAFGTKVITADMEEFAKPMFILLNLAIGGAWGGWVDASTVFPQTYVIDYVRVYANATTAPGGAPGLATSWHLLNGAASGVTPAGETLDSAAGTVSGFQPTKTLSAQATWYSAPLNGKYDAGAWSVGIFTTSPGAASVLKAELFRTAADGSGAVSLGAATVDTNATGGGNHRSWFTLTGVTSQAFANQRIKLVVTPISGAAAQMVYNGNDFDSLVTTPWSAAP